MTVRHYAGSESLAGCQKWFSTIRWTTLLGRLKCGFNFDELAPKPSCSGRYRREQLFEAARRSRACAYLADDDHGPLALQEILLAGCPTVGVRTGAAFVQHGEAGVLVDWLPPGPRCAESDDDVRALAVFIEAIDEAQSMDHHRVRDRAAEQFDTDRILDSLLIAVNTARRAGGIETAASV